jgi:hypothetical protein
VTARRGDCKRDKVGQRGTHIASYRRSCPEGPSSNLRLNNATQVESTDVMKVPGRLRQAPAVYLYASKTMPCNPTPHTKTLNNYNHEAPPPQKKEPVAEHTAAEGTPCSCHSKVAAPCSAQHL